MHAFTVIRKKPNSGAEVFFFFFINSINIKRRMAAAFYTHRTRSACAHTFTRPPDSLVLNPTCHVTFAPPPPPTHPPLLLLPERFFPNWRNLWRYFIVGGAFCGSIPLSLRLSAQPSDYPHVGTVIVWADLCSLTVNRCSIQPINKFIKVSAGFRHRALSSPE